MCDNAPAEGPMELFASGASANTLVITSPSSSSKSSSASSSQALAGAGTGGSHGARTAPVHRKVWWENMNKAQDCIKALNEVLGPLSSLEAMQDSERPAKCLLQDESVARAILAHLANPFSGHGQDALCQWFYNTFQTGEPDLQAVVLRFVPAICGLYLPRLMMQRDESLAGLEAVLLAIYNAETKDRNGRSLVRIPDLSQPSLYHLPRIHSNSRAEPQIGCLSAILEPQDTVRATKTACIVGTALDLFCRRIFFMPSEAKIEACQCALRLASLSCSSKEQESMDGDSSRRNGSSEERVLESNHDASILLPRRQAPEIEIVGSGELLLENRSPSKSHGAKANFAHALMQVGNGARIQLPWELLQPLLRILGHCLLAPLNPEVVREAASAAIDALHHRAFHDLVPEAMLATRSLLRLRMASIAITQNVSSSSNPASNSSWPRKQGIVLATQ